MEHVPFHDPARRARGHQDLILRLLDEVVESDTFILRKKVAVFEEQVRAALGAPHVIAVASATDALKLSLAALDIGPGDVVLTPALSFPAPAGAVVQRGAQVRFVDVDPNTGLLDLADLEERLGPGARAVVAVHQGRGLVDMPRLRGLAKHRGLSLVEDAAVCLGARLGGQPAGLWGDLGVYSFYPVKPLGGIGEGGVIVTGKEVLARRCRMLRNHGQDGVTRFKHHILGYNSRMDEITAGYLAERLSALPGLLRRRAAIVHRYDEQFQALSPEVVMPAPSPGEPVVYSYVLLARRRDELRRWLKARGIETCIPWPAPLPFQPAYASLGHRPGDFPGAESFRRRALALPLYPEMPDEHVEAVVAAVKEFCSLSAAGAVGVPPRTDTLTPAGFPHEPQTAAR